MSSDFYFKTWRSVLKRLKVLLDTDTYYQTEKVHDQHLADAVFRLTVVLGQYIILYNEAVKCLQNNLQVQKTQQMNNIVKALVSRILELKHHLQNIEGSQYRFFGQGLILYKQTTDDVEMTTISTVTNRPPSIQTAIENAFQKAKDIKAAEELAKAEVPVEEKKEVFINAFDIVSLSDSDISRSEGDEETEQIISIETRVRRDLIAMIIAHEKLRQVTRNMSRNKLKREMWEKELLGIAKPPARYELRVKSAKLIQKVFRAYFDIKRKRILDQKLDEVLGLNYCKSLNPEIYDSEAQRLTKRLELHDEYVKKCTKNKEKLKMDIIRRKGGEMTEDFRDGIRAWFYEWFEAIQFIHDIPNPGPIAIFRDEVPEPHEWLEEYEAIIKKKQDSQGKSPQELKYEAKEKKQLEKSSKKEMQKMKKAEAALLKKMMKHPTMHPGYNYPESKKTNHLVEALKDYHTAWDFYDAKEIPEVKRKYINEVSIQDAYKDVKVEMLNGVEERMQKEHKRLKNALREDYEKNEEEMPEQVTKRKRIRQKKIKNIPNEILVDKLEVLILDGWIIDYPKTKLRDYIGDPNFIGEDLRRLIVPASAHNFEVRALWWEMCEGVSHRCNKILLVGPEGSGKNKLVHILASINDAILYEVDPTNIPGEFLNEDYLKTLTKNMLFCAKAVPPSVIHIKHIQKLFYAKEPPDEAVLQLGLINKLYLQQLFKKIRKHDKITIIGTCTDPWLTQSKQLMKKFSTVILLPNTSYSIIVQLLKIWVMKHGSIPCNFDIGSLAHMLQGYSFGCLQQTLEKFMSAEQVARNAAYRLSPMDVYNFILRDEDATRSEYDRYLNWFWEKTPIGRKEKQHFDDMLEYKEAVAVFEAKEAKKMQQSKKAAAKRKAT